MVTAIIQARMSSSRLRGKTLMPLNGKPLLLHVIESVQNLNFIDKIIIVTSNESSDDPIEAFGLYFNVKVYRGHPNNVLSRFVESTENLNNNDTIVRFTADNPINIKSISEELFKLFINEKFDYACIKNLSHIVPEFIRVESLRKLFDKELTNFDKEHVTSFIRNSKDQFKSLVLDDNFMGLSSEYDYYLTVDTWSEAKMIESLLKYLNDHELSLSNIYSFLKNNIDNPHFYSDDHFVTLDKKRVGDNYDTFVIAEIGQNHNGDLDIAKELIDLAVDCGADAVKFQKRDLDSELSEVAANKLYDNPNSFGKSYMDHRKFLELSVTQLKELKDYANKKDIIFFVTPCDVKSLENMESIDVPFFKVASRDLTNIPLLEGLAKINKPVIISTGMSDGLEIETAIRILKKDKSQLIIMQCTSEYPTNIKNVNLNVINYYKQKYGYIVGLSDHTPGIITSVAGSVLGANIIEKHITLSRAMKGSDHAGSLEKEGLRRVVNYLKTIKLAEGNGIKRIPKSVQPFKEKLARSITSKVNISKGEILTEKMITLKSPGNGIKWIDKNILLNKKAKIDIKIDTTLEEKDFE
tara:strand:+ start:756 stop:2498 length:1743 start_codon:yes stop_codon:yes gene_type:complete